MCGIAGFRSADRRLEGAQTILDDMVSRLRHRGPDGRGFFSDAYAGLGHARLSIVGVSNGDQPLVNEDGTVQVIFNGEIFNHVELRRLLESRGHRFRTLSDGEVLVHGYEEEGMDFLERLNGQFAYALWDTRARRMHLVRDRLGILPLFYGRAGGDLYFASEVKALLAAPGIRPEIDREALGQIFRFWAPVPPRTVFSGIYQVLPGTYLTADSSGVHQTRYWDLDFTTRETGEEGREAERFLELFEDAVRMRLQADVPVGIYLSGGIDSSAAAAVAAAESRRIGGPPPETFSVRFDSARFDESREQTLVAEHLGLGNRYSVFSERELESTLARAIYHAETPALRTAFAPLWNLSRLTHASGYKAVVGGEGADEVMLGYDLFKEAKIRSFWARAPGSERRGTLFNRIYPFLAGHADERAAGAAFLRQALGRNFGNTDDPFYGHRARWDSTARTQRFFVEDLRVLGPATAKAGEAELLASMPQGFVGWDPVARTQAVEIRIFLTNYLLSTQGDRMSMAHSIEVRYPFLDHRLVEFMNALPPHRKMPGLREKALLKRAFRDRLPPGIIERHKHPYRSPGRLLKSLADSVGPLGQYVSEESLRRYGVFDPVRSRALVEKASASASDPSESDQMAISGILTTQIFCHQFMQ